MKRCDGRQKRIGAFDDQKTSPSPCGVSRLPVHAGRFLSYAPQCRRVTRYDSVLQLYDCDVASLLFFDECQVSCMRLDYTGYTRACPQGECPTMGIDSRTASCPLVTDQLDLRGLI